VKGQKVPNKQPVKARVGQEDQQGEGGTEPCIRTG
jgi:hypothetical protein